MKLNIIFLSALALLLLFNNVLAQDAKTDNDSQIDKWRVLRHQAMEEDIKRLIVGRDKAMEEDIKRLIAGRDKAMEGEMYKISGSKEKNKIFVQPLPKSLAFRPRAQEINSASGLFSIQNTRNALDISFESEQEDRKITSSSQPAHRSRLLLEESLETDFKGSVYHPNLASFDIALENGIKQSRERFQPNLTGKLKSGYLDRFHIASYFLRKKPYAFSLLADKSREIENREFFERQVINSTRYGGNFGFKNELIPVGFSFYKSSKDIDRVSRASQESQDDEISLNLSNESEIIGQTRFEAAQNKFSRTESGTPNQEGATRDFSLLNQKFLSSDKKKYLNSFLHFYGLTGARESQVLNLNENLNIEHTNYLESSYTYNFSDRSSSGIKTTDNRAGASLRHRLYESLVSSFSPYYFKSESNATSQDTYGLSLDEDYTKKLGKDARLSLGVGLAYSQEKRESPDSVISIVDESHTLTTGTVTLLDRPGVDTQTVAVTDVTGATAYTLNLDYQLSSVGVSMQIQRLAGGSIANGQGVLVDYQAKSSPSLRFSTLGNAFRARMDFLDNLIGIFYRLNKERHPEISGQEDFILQTLADTSFGFDLNYKNLSVELEQENFDSSLSSYKRLRLRESFFFNPSEKSTLTFGTSQIIVRLVDTLDTQRFFDYVTRYSIGLNRYSRFGLEVGYRWQEGSGIDLNDLVSTANYELNFGKLLMNLKYDFKKQIFLGDRLLNHFFHIKIKREF